MKCLIEYLNSKNGTVTALTVPITKTSTCQMPGVRTFGLTDSCSALPMGAPWGDFAFRRPTYMGLNLFSNFQLLEESHVKQRRPKGECSITQLPNGKLKMTISIGVDITR